MPFVANTPESLLARTDSKISSNTCRGVTSAGKPCRRSVSPDKTAAPSRKKIRNEPQNTERYCWQHQDQAAHETPSKASSARPGMHQPGHRTSVDTLTDRLNLMGLEDKRQSHGRPSRPSGATYSRPPKPYAPAKKRHPILSLCCFGFPLDSSEPPSRPHHRPQHQSQARPQQKMPQLSHRPTSAVPAQVRPGHKRQQSQTGAYMKLIPPTLDPGTASILLAELAKGFTEAEEPGYIYMFWLTPDSDPAPPKDAARSLMEATLPSSRSPSKSAARRKPLLLKIGRAANVQRRMNQWSQQCGHSVEILRFYPYIPSGSTASPRMTPHVKKVERLIHLELSGMGMRAELDKCKVCGKDHREWFQVEQSREAVARVDEVIRRWVSWDEGRR
ncbi:SpvB domain-containing protein [Ceratocystis lukuohia]|uniref:SpvB domain-containing protein n=1 Tax=Ceratocystis lukuohia TaxID=2019550 RepID=A0ABR4MUB5_9PEZI